ncbi:unnamed protein product, partial [Didymodactylos carnosus]
MIPILLVGSVPLANNEQVFKCVSEIIGSHLRYIPDGETGKRYGWIEFQEQVFACNPLLKQEPPADVHYGPSVGKFRFCDGSNPMELKFDNLGYSEAALNSFALFKKLKEDGTIPTHVRFQVSLPTPLAPCMFLADSSAIVDILPAYRRALFAELELICAEIPHDQLAVQWDVCLEFAILENRSAYKISIDQMFSDVVDLGTVVPEDVHVGFHLCYGDYAHKHFVEPNDSSKLVQMANTLSKQLLSRAINWIHLPIPRNRTDDDYFRPMKDLELKSDTELYLGLIHLTDGVDGSLHRAQTAKKALGSRP